MRLRHIHPKLNVSLTQLPMYLFSHISNIKEMLGLSNILCVYEFPVVLPVKKDEGNWLPDRYIYQSVKNKCHSFSNPLFSSSQEYSLLLNSSSAAFVMTTEMTTIRNLHRQASQWTPTVRKCCNCVCNKAARGSGWRTDCRHTDTVARAIVKHPWDLLGVEKHEDSQLYI